tara:strand:+ start:14061 stop:15860 length:1800 start_codon:yes stop_codon:yes gene_type:complete
MISLILLSKRFVILLILIFSFFSKYSYAEPKDIWKKSKEIEIKKSNEKKIKQIKDKSINKDLPQTIFDKGKVNLSINKINQTDEIKDDEIIFGLYDPQDLKINLNFWSTIDQNTYERFIKSVLQKNKKSLAYLSEKILFTKTNLASFSDNGSEHLSFITKWLIQNQKMDLIDKVVRQNKEINKNSDLIKYMFIHYLSEGQTDKGCNYVKLKNISTQSTDLDKFKIFCLIKNKKIKQGLSQLELTKETSSLDNFFVEKINFLSGVSEKKGKKNFDNVFNAHLTLQANEDFDIKFENFSKSKELRNYFFKSGIAGKLLEDTMNKSSANEKNKLNALVIFLERSANENLYQSSKILEIYKKYNFSFDQLFKVDDAVKKLKRPESHAILYQAMLLAQNPETKIKILNSLKEKLSLNGLVKIAEPIYYSELSKILSVRKDLVDKKIVQQIEIYNKNKKTTLEFDNNFIYSSELKKLFKAEISKKEKKKILKLLGNFDKKIKDKKYQLNNKDIAFINLLKKEKIDLPSTLSKYIYNEKVYIPNEIFNSIEKKLNDEALIKTIIYLAKINENNVNYTRDILAIVKVFDKIKQDELKQIFLENEFST